MRDSFISELTELAQKNSNIILITGDLGFGVLDEYIRTVPNQFLNAGVAEQNMTGIATGLALEGKTVFTYSIGNFNTLRCLEQIRNDACYHNANVNIVSVGGGFSYGPLGYSHHATEDIAIMRSIPNMRVFAPSSSWEVKKIVQQMVNLDGVNYLRIDKSSAPSIESSKSKLEIGKSRIIKDGTDIAIFSCGGILELAMKARELLKNEGISVRVISMHTIKPFDEKIVIECAKQIPAILTLEEHAVSGGLGSIICETLIKNKIVPNNFQMMGLESKFSTIVGSQDYLREINNIGLKSIIENVRKLTS